MNVYRFKCKSCGATKYDKIDENTYECKYCKNREEVHLETKQEPVIIEKEPEIETTEPIVKANPQTQKALVKLLICIFLGVFGVHRFLEHRLLSGIIYFFTFGLFGIGICFDALRYILEIAKYSKNDNNGGD